MRVARAVVVVQVYRKDAGGKVAADALIGKETMVMPGIETHADARGIDPRQKFVQPFRCAQVLKREIDVRAFGNFRQTQKTRKTALGKRRRSRRPGQVYDERSDAVNAGFRDQSRKLGTVMFAGIAVLPD